MLPLFLFLWGVKPSNKPAFVRVFAQVEHRQLRPDKAGTIALPKGDQHLTTNGKIYITRRNGLLMVLFPLWIGKGSNLRGVLVCNRAIGSSRSVTIFAPGPWGGEDRTSPEYVSPLNRQVEVDIEREVWPHAYRVLRDLD